ncbi:MAG: PKD domain-containing protein [Bacteroidia bacterium]
MNIKFTIILTLFLLILSPTLSAQKCTPYNTANTSTALSNSSIYDIAIESSTVKWVATAFGVSKMDGGNWTSYTKRDGLISNYVYVVSIDLSNKKWFGTKSGVSTFDGSRWASYTTSQGLVNNNVNCITADIDSTVWIGTDQGVSHFDGVHFKSYTVADGLIANRINDIVLDSKGNKWFATNSGISKFDGTTWTNYSGIAGWVDNAVGALAIDRQDNIWAAKANGLSMFDGSTWTNHVSPYNSGQANLRAITIDNQNVKWLGAYSGLSTFDGTNWTLKNGIDGSVSHIEIDDQNRKWFNDGFTLTAYDDINTIRYSAKGGLADNRIYTISVDKSDNMWFGTDEGVSMYNGSTWETYTKADGLPTNIVYSSDIDTSGIVWLGQWNGLASFNGTSWSSYNDVKLGVSVAVEGKSMFIDRMNQKWVGLQSGDGVLMINDVKTTHYPSLGIQYFGDVSSIVSDKKGNIWFGTTVGFDPTTSQPAGGGVTSFDGKNWAPLSALNDGFKLSIVDVRGIAIDTKDNKWIATNSGLYKYDNVSVTKELDAIITAVHVDNKGNVWAGTFDKVSKFDGITWVDYALPSYLESTHANAIANDSKNNIWIGTDNAGVIKLDLSRPCIAPKASYSFSDNGKGNYTFNNTSIGDFNQFHWAYGDGSVGTTMNSTHTFSANGTYVVVLTVNDSTQLSPCFDYYLDTIDVVGVTSPAKCNAGFVVYPAKVNGDITIVNSSSGTNLNYIWNFGDGTPFAAQQNPSHTYSTAGPFNLSLIVSDVAGCTDSYSESIGRSGVLFNRIAGFTINVIPSIPDVTGIDKNIGLNSKVTIFPNPTSEQLSITSDGLTIERILIVDLTGKTLKTITKDLNKISVADLSNGLYFIKVITVEQIITKKFIKQ